MKTYLKAFCAVLVVLFSGAASATQVTGKVTLVDVSNTYPGFVFVKLESAPNPPIACQTNTAWTYTLPMNGATGQRLYATLMTAYATKASVTMFGSGTCSDYGSIESATGVRLFDN